MTDLECGPKAQINLSDDRGTTIDVGSGIAIVAEKSLTPPPKPVRRSLPLSGLENLMGFCVLHLWVGVFTAGLLVGTAPYRKKLIAYPWSMSLQEGLRCWITTLIAYTLPNVLLLCCLSALLGALGRRARMGGDERGLIDSLRSFYLSAVIRGFFVFLALLSGMLVLTGEAFINAEQKTYIHLAATAALFSFLTGHNPRLFALLRDRLDDFANPPAPEKAPLVKIDDQHTEQTVVVNNGS